MKSERIIRKKLQQIEIFCKKEGHTLEEMEGEIQGLRWVVDELGEDI